jgi:hypothetical protein
MALRQRFVNALVTSIFTFEDARYNKEINDLITENSQYLGHGSLGFNYKGQEYGWDGNPIKNSDSLSSFLIPRMVQASQLRAQAENDRKLISQVLLQLVTACGHEDQDLRDALPECIVTSERFVPSYEHFPRTREPGWPLMGNERAYRQFLKITTKIEMYYALKFIL